MEYPSLPRPVIGPGATHHFALVVESTDELAGWRDYLRGRGIETTDVLDRGALHSLYLRDPDGHVVELATRGPGFEGRSGAASWA
jgi:glyoxalase family protein